MNVDVSIRISNEKIDTNLSYDEAQALFWELHKIFGNTTQYVYPTTFPWDTKPSTPFPYYGDGTASPWKITCCTKGVGDD